MKILHIVPTYVPAYRYGGPIKSVHYLNKWLVKMGIDVTVYTTNLNGDELLDVPLSKECLIDGVKVYYFPITWKVWEYSFALHRALAKNIKNFDLVHITSVFLSVSTLGAFYAKKFKKPYIISPRGSLMKEPLEMKSNFKKRMYISLIEKCNLKNADTVHFTAESEKEEYIKAGFPLKRSVVLPNGIDPEEFSSEAVAKNKINFREKYGIDADKKIILSLGRINWKKGFDTLIPAFAEVLKKEPNTVLVIAGEDDGYKKEVNKLIDKHNVRPHVMYAGMLLGEDRIAAFRDSDVFTLPSYSENFGMAVGESIACGTPVVITKGVGIAPLIEKAGPDIGLVTEKNTEQYARAILTILKKPKTQETIKHREKFVETQFLMPKIAEKFIVLYKELVQNKN